MISPPIIWIVITIFLMLATPSLAQTNEPKMCSMSPPAESFSIPKSGWRQLDKEYSDNSCPNFRSAMRQKMRTGNYMLSVYADGPGGSGRYWHVGIGISQKNNNLPDRGVCLSTTTIGWRTLQRFEGKALQWVEDLDGDGNAELVFWSSFSLANDGDEFPEVTPSGIIAWVYSLETNSQFTLNVELTRRLAQRIIKSYRGPLIDTRGKPIKYERPWRSRAANRLEILATNECTLSRARILLSDYQPKKGIDGVLDYRPNLLLRIQELQPINDQTFHEAVTKFTFLKLNARANSGKWTDGKLYLGAAPREYVPSDDELLLAEYGDRLASYVHSRKVSDLIEAWNGESLLPLPLEYSRFNYRHVDVVGSGRYFYASKPMKTIIE